VEIAVLALVIARNDVCCESGVLVRSAEKEPLVVGVLVRHDSLAARLAGELRVLRMAEQRCIGPYCIKDKESKLEDVQKTISIHRFCEPIDEPCSAGTSRLLTVLGST